MGKGGGIGGIDESEIAATWERLVVPPGDAGATPFARFCIYVVALISKRAAAPEGGDFAVFLMSEAIRQDKGNLQVTHMPFLENGNDKVSGNCWLVSPTLKDAYRLNIPCTDQTVLFQDVVCASLGSLPTIILDRRGGAPKAYSYPKGLDAPEEKDQLVIEDRPITEQEMKIALDRFYETTLRTPRASSEGHGLKIWKVAWKGIPEERPEERIQGRAVDQLRAKFPRYTLRAEPVTEDGRADIAMFSPVVSAGGHRSLRYDWVLELKALCDKTTTGKAVAKSKIIAAVKSGVEQVVAYREGFSANRGALCCYDMRANDEGPDVCFAHVARQAEAHNAPLWRWYLYRSTENSRKARSTIGV
jgi:hypothetical protein